MVRNKMDFADKNENKMATWGPSSNKEATSLFATYNRFIPVFGRWI